MKKKILVSGIAAFLGISSVLAGCSSASSSSGTVSSAAETTGEAVETTAEETADSFTWEGKDPADYVSLGAYENIPYAPDDVSVSEEEIDTILNTMLSYTSSYEHITEGTVKDGDTVNIDFAGTMADPSLQSDGLSAENQTVTIGVSSYIDGFLDSLIGAKIGDTVTADLVFPDDYPQKTEFEGQAVTFEIKINYVQGEAIEPELTDERANEYTSGQCPTLEDLRSYIRNQLKTEKESQAETNSQNSVWASVVANAELLSYPEGLVEYYYADQKKMLSDYAAYNNQTLDEYLEANGYTNDTMEEVLMEYSQECAKSAIVNRTLAQLFELSITEEEYQAELETLAANYGYTDLNQMVLDAGGRLQIEDTLIFRKVIAEIMKTAVADPSLAETTAEETTTAESSEGETTSEETSEGEAEETSAEEASAEETSE